MLLEEKNIKGITVRMYHNCIEISSIVNNQYYHRKYIGYTEEQAISLFKTGLSFLGVSTFIKL
jgi:hypothetical protein